MENYGLFLTLYFGFVTLIILLMGYGIWSLSKKMGLKHSWMGWIPYLQYYTMTKIAGMNFVKDLLIPLIIYIVAIIIGSFSYMFGEIAGIIGALITLIGLIYFIVKYIKILSATSKRTGRGGWTTAGLFFIPFIMYPVIATKFKLLSEEKEEKVVEL